jgi:hypothetical protein
MKLVMLLSVILALQGCATGCVSHCLLGFGPGNPAFESVAAFHDNRDPCQFTGKAAGYQLPSYCGASKGKVVRIDRVTPTTFIVNRY